MDETYVKIQGRWCYLYRGIDEYGNLLDVRLSEHRDRSATKAFFEQVAELMPEPPERVVTDGHSSYPRAISEMLGESVQHEVSKSVHNPVEQSHRKLKQRYNSDLAPVSSEIGVFKFPVIRENRHGTPMVRWLQLTPKP